MNNKRTKEVLEGLHDHNIKESLERHKKIKEENRREKRRKDLQKKAFITWLMMFSILLGFLLCLVLTN